MAPAGWKQLSRMRGHEKPITGFAWSPTAAHLVSYDSRGQFVIWNAKTGKPIHALREPSGAIRTVTWSPRGDAIALATEDDLGRDPLQPSLTGTPQDDWDPDDQLIARLDFDSLSLEQEPVEPLYLRIVDVDSGLHIGAIGFRSDTVRPKALVWTRQDRLYTASTDGVSMWQPEDGHYLGRLKDSQHDNFSCLTATVDGGKIAAAGKEGNIMVWDSETGIIDRHFESDMTDFLSIAFAAGYNRVAAGTGDGLVEVWDFSSDEPELRTLEAHYDSVITVSFSADGKFLATGSDDGSVKLWDSSDWSLVSEMSGSSIAARTSVHFSPKENILGGAINGDQALRTWILDIGTLAARRKRPKTVHYTNAKVVLLGDTGVGKTGLGLVLSGQSFRATESTHQRNVWPLPGVCGDASADERREVFLWDLAGQPGYRLLHQLHLGDVAVALVVFDGKSELDPLSGVRHWARALNQAIRQSRSEQDDVARILVAARLDRGRPRASDDEISSVRQNFGFDKYVTTSAKESKGVAALLREITQAIDWDSQPRVSSTQLFDAIRGFLLQKGDSEIVLATETELRQAFLETGAASSRRVSEEFRVCVDRAQARGLVRRFSFGDLILLKPEVLDAYAAAVLHAAGAGPDGLGEISEASVRDAQFDIPIDSRLTDNKIERLLLIATIEDLLRHEVALREDSGDGPFLVFPTQNRQHIAIPEPLRPWSRIGFEGPVQHVWATLVVRLAHSGVFVREAVGQDCAIFRASGESVAVRLELLDEGQATIQLLREASEPGHNDLLFEQFVEAHLERRAVWHTVHKSRLLVCRSCGFVVPDGLIDALGDLESFNCPICPSQIVLREQTGKYSDPPTRAEVRSLEQTADSERTRLTARTAVQGKAAVKEFDTFLAYNSIDFPTVKALQGRLHDFGLNPWIDRDQVPPGRWVQDVLEDAIGKSASAVICIGPTGLGKWQVVELRTFVEECVNEGIPVIPALLPQAKMPSQARFLKTLEYVRFINSIDEEDSLRRLVWGITGKKSTL